MAGRVLVAYESRGGATREVAEAVARVLLEEGLEPDVRSVRDRLRFSDYDGYVLGAPVRIGRWAPRMKKFVADGAAAMRGKPVAVFAVGASFAPPDEETAADPEKAANAADYADKCRERVHRWCDRLEPVAFATFPGVMRPEAFPRLLRRTTRNLPVRDARDWDEIGAWAREVAGKLRP
ncbi:MAG: hypothetical protein IBX62_00765 [Coriobacteriia bacterium]|nr:hypothetical protein [Coriobacteriia bacterium]